MHTLNQVKNIINLATLPQKSEPNFSQPQFYLSCNYVNFSTYQIFQLSALTAKLVKTNQETLYLGQNPGQANAS